MARRAALVILALAFLPPASGGRWFEWLGGTTLAVAVGAVLAALAPRLTRHRPLPSLADRWWTGGRRADLLVAVAAIGAYAILSHVLFDGRPAVIDEVVALWQAEWLARGHVSGPLTAPLAAILTPYTAERAGRLMGQYHPGGPLLLVPGVWAGLPWLVVPIWGGGGVYVWARLVRRLEPDPATALGAVVLLALSAFWAALAASQLGHVPTVTLLLAGGVCFAAAVQDDAARPRTALAMGCLLGAAAVIRPLEAAAFAVPAGAALLWRARRGQPHLLALLVSGGGMAVMLAVVAALNGWHTGDPLQFGYIAVWGPAHAPGFHAAPWGPAHTPALGLRNTLRNVQDLQDLLHGGVVPALLAPLLALAAWRRRLGAADRWLLVASGLLVVAYWAYWHDGRWLGPRFHLPLVPVLALWTARLPRALGGSAGRVAGWAIVTMVVLGTATGVPRQYADHRRVNAALRTDVRALFNGAGVRDGVVLVREEPWRVASAELRAVGVANVRARALGSADPCASRVAARADTLPAELDTLPSIAALERQLCGEGSDADLTGADGSAAILLGTTPTRLVVRDRGADNLSWMDETTVRERTWVLSWEPGGWSAARAPHLVRLDADSALADWARVRDLRAGRW